MHMTRTVVLATLAGLLLLPVRDAAAQSMPNPGGMAPDTPRMEKADPPKDHANTHDLLFVRQMALGGRAEAELGKLAQKKASSKRVQDFGKQMASEHAKANETLLDLSAAKGASIPGELDPEQQRIRTELEKTSGADFDAAYLTSQVQDHQKTANLLLWEISFGQSASLTKYAADTLPIVMEHLETASQELNALSARPRDTN
jgi:putative membrane protein